MAMTRTELDEQARMNGLDTTSMSDKELRSTYKEWTGEDIEPKEKAAKKPAPKKPVVKK